jgi:protein-tyrosine phosphatase
VIDLHCHLLPGVDDGPAELAESVAMCRAALADGTQTLFATPHYNHPVWPNDDLARLDALRAELASALGGEPTVLSGAEIRATSSLLEDLERQPRSGVPSLAGSRYLLLEFDRSLRPPVDAQSMVHELVIAGWVPVIAHPEFVPWLHGDLDATAGLVARGALLQVTAQSLVGQFGPRPAAFCAELIDAALLHFVASDTHGLLRRPPGLSRARALVAERWGEATARAIFELHPEAVVADRPLPMAS